MQVVCLWAKGRRRSPFTGCLNSARECCRFLTYCFPGDCRSKRGIGKSNCWYGFGMLFPLWHSVSVQGKARDTPCQPSAGGSRRWVDQKWLCSLMVNCPLIILNSSTVHVRRDPKFSHQRAGAAESTARNQYKTLRHALEVSTGNIFTTMDAIKPWMVGLAAWVSGRFCQKAEKGTAHCRIDGVACTTLFCLFCGMDQGKFQCRGA